MSETKSPRERAATRVTIAATILGILVVLADLAWISLTALYAEDEDVSWGTAASATGAELVWAIGIGLMTLVGLWLLVVAVRYRADHHRETTSTWRVYILSATLTGMFSLFAASVTGAVLAVAALGLVVGLAGSGPELTEHQALLLRFERLMTLLILTLFLALSPVMLAFYTSGSGDASASAREAWMADQGAPLTLAAQVVATLAAVAYVVVVVRTRSAAGRIAFLPTQLALLGVTTVLIAAIPGWWFPPAIAALGLVVLLTVRRVTKQERLEPISWSGGHGLM